MGEFAVLPRHTAYPPRPAASPPPTKGGVGIARPDYSVSDPRRRCGVQRHRHLESRSPLVDEVVEHALDGTDDTNLTLNFGLLSSILLTLAADARDQDRLELLR